MKLWSDNWKHTEENGLIDWKKQHH